MVASVAMASWVNVDCVDPLSLTELRDAKELFHTTTTMTLDPAVGFVAQVPTQVVEPVLVPGVARAWSRVIVRVISPLYRLQAQAVGQPVPFRVPQRLGLQHLLEHLGELMVIADIAVDGHLRVDHH